MCKVLAQDGTARQTSLLSSKLIRSTGPGEKEAAVVHTSPNERG